MMVVKSLQLLRKNYYSPVGNMGPLVGKIEFVSHDENTIQLQLTEEQTQRIMAVVADALLASTKSVADILTQQVVEQVAGVPALGQS